MSDDDYPLDPGAYITSHAYIHHRPTDARQVILDLTRERDEARAEVERLRVENKRVRAEMIRVSEENRRLREETGILRAVISQLQDDLSSRVMGSEGEQ